MKLDPGIHIVKHLVFFGKSGVTLVHVVETLTQEYCFPVTKSLPRAPLDSPQRLAT
jgi:hypothetical protein